MQRQCLARLEDIEVVPREVRVLRLAPTFFANGQESQAGREHGCFLRSGHANVDAPVVLVEREDTDGANPVNNDQCFTFCTDNLGNGMYVESSTGGGLTVREKQRSRVRMLWQQRL